MKKVEVTALIQCTGVWITGGKFGVSWKAVQMRLDSVPAGIHGYSFEEEGDAEGADAAEFSQPAGGRPAMVDYEDEEEQEQEQKPSSSQARQVAESEEEQEEEVAPAPVPKKRVVTAKKVVAAVAKK